MATRERIYTVDDVWRLACAPENDAKKICLINGELLITMSPSRLHGRSRYASDALSPIMPISAIWAKPQSRWAITRQMT